MGSDREEKKMVKRVKEILHDRPEQEILAMLKECGMDPDEAVQRLLSQDTFHEVKSKRERRKEMKETQDTKSLSQTVSSVSNGGWSIVDDGRTTIRTNSNAPGTAAYKRENGSVAYLVSYSSSTSHAAGKPICQQSMQDSDFLNAEIRGQSIGMGRVATSSSQPPTKSEGCGPVTHIGRPSVADIVRKGSLQNGLLELAEASIRCQDEGQEPDAHSNSENLSSFECHPSLGMLRPYQKDCADEQLTSDSDITCKTGTQGAASDSRQVSYLGKPLPEQTEEDSGTVVLPSHVQALAADCSHLSFGTYNSKSCSLKIDSEIRDGLSTQELYANQWRRQQMLGAAFGDAPVSVSRGFEKSSHELMWEPGYASSYRKEEVPQHLGEMQRAIGLQGNSLVSSGQSLKTDSLPSTFLEDPPLPLRISAAASSFKHPTVCLPETLMPDTFHPFEQSARTTLACRGLTHQLLEQVYSQQNSPLKQYGNISSFRNFSDGCGQIPSHQSLGCAKFGIPQYKRDNLSRNLGMPDYGSSDVGRFESANTLLGGYIPNSPVASSLPAVGYDNMLQNQIIQERNHFLPHGLGDDSLVGWGYGAGAGGISTAQEKAYHNLQLEKQLNLRHQQDQQIPRDYASLANLSSYYSQASAAPESQLLQGFGDMTLNNGADPFSKQHLWQQLRH